MKLPPKVTVPTCIEQGSIYHFKLERINSDGTKYIGNRFFIVLNVNPKTDGVLVLTTVTTKIQKTNQYVKKVHADPKTIVKISPSDFSRLSQESAVNCNTIYTMTREDLISKLEEDGGVVFFEKLPKTTIEVLISGTLKSNQVANEYKKFLI